MVALFAYLFIASLGYIIFFILASFIGPKVANKLSGKISLYAAMVILPIVVIMVFSLSMGLAFYFLGEDLIYILPIILIFTIITNLLIYLFSPWIIDLSFFARKDDYLQSIVDRVKSRLGYKGKITALVAKGPPNAFAYGNIISGKRVAVTESLIKSLDEKELEAVVGHEIGHHKHKDSVLMILFGLLPTIIYYLGVIIMRSSIFSRNRKSNGLWLITIFGGLLLVLLSFLVQVLVLAFSRLREYYADLVGARATSKIDMQKALAKIYLYYKSNKDYLLNVKNNPMSTLFIYALANPFISVSEEDIERIKSLEENNYLEIFQTHPPISKRLRFLDKAI
ncbi:MAG: M48 family metalloprotease [Nanopusillaceae archaeon]